MEKLTDERETPEYLAYLYSERFPRDAEKQIKKIYESVHGLFASEECKEVATQLLTDCRRRQELYVRVKNASVRVRRAVLGEMKDDKEGGFYFTKPFRTLMSAFVQIEDFLTYVLDEAPRTPDHFFRQFVEFYHCAKYAHAYADSVFDRAVQDLNSLRAVVEREIVDLKRYRIRGAEGEAYTYADRIARRGELIEEIDRIAECVREMAKGCGLFSEFFSVMKLSGYCAALGRCKTSADIVRWLYRETVKKYKAKFGMKGVYPSDGYALCFVLTAAGRKLTPRYGLVFVDEGQDISEGEYNLLRRIHTDAAFNVFGDLKQNITPWRGMKSWESLGCNEYGLDVNYRNTNEIVEYVSGVLEVDMKPIGLHGERVEKLKMRQMNAFFREKQGLRAVIAKEEYLPLFEKRGYRLLGAGELSRSKINVMSVYESKGLEFSSVAVYDKGMTENEKYIAYTRALRDLAVIED